MQRSLKRIALEPASLSSSTLTKQSVVLVFTEPGVILTEPAKFLKILWYYFPSLKYYIEYLQKSIVGETEDDISVI